MKTETERNTMPLPSQYKTGVRCTSYVPYEYEPFAAHDYRGQDGALHALRSFINQHCCYTDLLIGSEGAQHFRLSPGSEGKRVGGRVRGRDGGRGKEIV